MRLLWAESQLGFYLLEFIQFNSNSRDRIGGNGEHVETGLGITYVERGREHEGNLNLTIFKRTSLNCV